MKVVKFVINYNKVGIVLGKGLVGL